MRGDNDNAEGAGGPFQASAPALFLPSLLVLAGYAAALLWLWLTGRGDGALAGFCVAVLAIGGPLLVAHAGLRRLTIRVDALPHAAYVQRGFPHFGALEIPYALIRRLTLTRGPLSRVTGAGTLTFEIAGGTSILVPDLDRPAEALAAVAGRMEAAASALALQDDPREPDDSRSVLHR